MLILIPGVVLILSMFLIPVLMIFYQGLFDPHFTSEHFLRFATRGAYVKIFLNSLQISAVVALLSLLLGYPTAYFIVRQRPEVRPILVFLILVPLWMSILARTYAWMVVLGKEGVINFFLLAIGITDQPLQMLFTTGAVYIAMVQILLPIMIVTCLSSMTSIDQSLLRAARVMGAGPFSAFRKVFLPLSAEGAVTGTLLVFILSVGFFVVPALLGGRRDSMIANVVAKQVEVGNWGFAATLGIIMLMASLLVLIITRALSNRFLHRESENVHA
jgi:putative spermidine/putrescine transport system permease protein